MGRKLKPVSIDGIEFDALMDEDKNFSAEIPEYTTEDGYSVSDTIILQPETVNMTLVVSNTPVTWLKRHGSGMNRVQDVCAELEKLYFERKLVKVVTSEKTYTNMGITSITISKTSEEINQRDIAVSFKKVYTTKKKTVYIPSYLLKSGDTMRNAGSVSSPESSKAGSTAKSEEESKKSILYGIAGNIGLL